MILREFQPRDASQLSRLIERTMRRSNSVDYSLDQLKPLIAYFSAEKLIQLNRERVCIVADRDGIIVGTGALEGSHIWTFFVDPDVQRCGIGSALLARLEELAISRAIPRLYIESSTTGLYFYERRGYCKTGKLIDSASGAQIEVVKTLT